MDFKPLIGSTPPPVNTPRKKALEMLGLSTTTFVLVATIVINLLAASSDCAKFGFKNQTADVSNLFYTQITPAGWTFAIWGVIYTWQLLWVAYAWTFVFRQNFQKTISPLVYVFYNIANVGNIVWIYLWGNLYPQVAFPFIVVIFVSLWVGVGIEAVYLYQIKPVQGAKTIKYDYYITQFLVVNGLVVYGTWLAIATLINFDIVLSYYGTQTSVTAGTVSLSLLAFELLVYFVIENTVLDRYIRYVFMVYPVAIWALSGVASAHYNEAGGERNFIITTVLLGVTVLLFLARIVLFFVFAFFRPLTKPLDRPLSVKAEDDKTI